MRGKSVEEDKQRKKRSSARLWAPLSTAAIMFLPVLAGLLALLCADRLWIRYLNRWDPPMGNPYYHQLKLARFITAPLLAGLLSGAVSALARKRRRYRYALACATVQMGAVSLWWLRPWSHYGAPFFRARYLLTGQQWPLLLACLPLGALLAAALVSCTANRSANSNIPHAAKEMK